MRVKVKEIDHGLHPSQVVIRIESRDGPEELVINRSLLDPNRKSIDVGQAVGRQPGAWLIELPAETGSGAWRIWVNENEVINGGGALEAAE